MSEGKEEPQPQRPFIPGYEQPCKQCVYRDYYDINKVAKDQSSLVNNLRNQLVAVTAEWEKLKKPEEIELEKPGPEPEETVEE